MHAPDETPNTASQASGKETSMPVTLAYNPSRTAPYHPERQDTIFESGWA